MLNRRDFLKAAAIVTIGIPTLTNAKQKLRWILLTEQMPQPGQKVIFVNMYSEGFEGGVITYPSHFRHKGDDEFNVTIAMTRIDFVQCYRDKYKKSMIAYVYSDEGEEVLKSRSWLKSKVKREYSYHKPLYLNNTSARYRKKDLAWLPVNGEYPTEIPLLSKVKKWIAFKDEMPIFTIDIEVKDGFGREEKAFLAAEYCGKYWIKYTETCDNRLIDKIYLMTEPNIKYWSWRYA